MRRHEKKRIRSKASVWITVISLLLAPCSMGKAAASQPDSTEAGTEQEAKRGIFQVIFPSDTEHVFDFIMDPQKLISQTDAAAYEGSVFEEDATLFFQRRDGGVPEDYSSSSDALVITNAGTADVDLTVTASISMDSMEGIALTGDREFTDDTGASLYLALTDGEHTAAIDEEEGASIRTALKGASAEGGTVSEYRFWLTGAVNENGDWSAVESAVPKVTVTWNVTPHEPEQQEEARNQEENNLLEEEQNPSIDEDKAEQAADGKGKEPENNAATAQPDLPVENKSDTSGATETPEGSETPDESGKTASEVSEPSEGKENPGELDQSEKDGGSEDPKASEDETDSGNPKPSEDETDPGESKPAEENAGSKGPESPGENVDLEGQEQSEKKGAFGEKQISGEAVSSEEAEDPVENKGQDEQIPSTQSINLTELEKSEE